MQQRFLRLILQQLPESKARTKYLKYLQCNKTVVEVKSLLPSFHQEEQYYSYLLTRQESFPLSAAHSETANLQILPHFAQLN